MWAVLRHGNYRFSWPLLLLLLASCLLAQWQLFPNSRTSDKRETADRGDQTTVSPSKQAPDATDARTLNFEKKYSFFLWTPDLEGDLTFIIQFGAELAALGHKVMLESPVDGEVLQQLDPKYDFGARVNPFLQKVLWGKLSALDAFEEEPQFPDFVVLFSSTWHRSLADLPRKHPDGPQFLWFFYRPAQKCKTQEDPRFRPSPLDMLCCYKIQRNEKES